MCCQLMKVVDGVPPCAVYDQRCVGHRMFTENCRNNDFVSEASQMPDCVNFTNNLISKLIN